jgi:hypothetical protein
MVSEERPSELVEASSVIAEYARLIGENGSNDKLFDHTIIPFARNTDQFWWSVLLCTKPFRSVYSGEQPMISPPETNKSRTPKEECQLLPRKALEDAKLDVDWLLDDEAPEKIITIVQLNPTSNFLDRAAYKQVKMELWKFASYVMAHKLIQHASEVPRFLTYDLAVFANTPSRCVALQHKPALRNTPANLLTIDKKSLDAQIDIHGKVFVVANGLDLQEDELREVVIFCMGQAETTELKLKSWDKLKDRLQEEARKFALSAQHIRGRRQ